jgi:phage tail tube protein FII
MSKATTPADQGSTPVQTVLKLVNESAQTALTAGGKNTSVTAAATLSVAVTEPDSGTVTNGANASLTVGVNHSETPAAAK